MYFPVGWPKVLDGRKATGGHPVKIFRHRTRDLVIEVRSSSVAFWHSRLCILVSSYVRSEQCIGDHGYNTTAALKADGTIMVIATSKCKLLFLRLHYSKVSNVLQAPPPRNSHWTRNHGMFVQSPLEGGVAGREVEVVQVSYLRETTVMGSVMDILSMGNQVLVATSYGIFHRLSWEGSFYSSLAIDIHQVPFANDAHPESRGQTLPPNGMHTRQICYSPVLHGFAVVLSDGRGAFLSSSSSRYDPAAIRGVWVRGVADAVCVGINAKYRLLAFGKTNGSVDVYCGDDGSGEWNLSHTLQFTRRQFPDTGMQLGEVSCVEWSVPDGMCVAVSWKNGGLSLWSVFGSLLLCSLGDQPGTPSPLNPHCTILETLCWSSDGYHLWMLPMPSGDKPGGRGTHAGANDAGIEGGGSKHVLVMEFMRNSIVSNPIMANHRHLLLQGSDRLYLNTSHSFPRRSNTTMGRATPPKPPPPAVIADNHRTNIGSVSSPQWKVISLPSTYMILNWPVQYAAVSDSGCNLAVSGKAGFALYSTSRRKWKLFGNEVQEQGLVCRGGLLWYHEVIIFPCRAMDKREEVRFYSLHSNLDNSQLLDSLKVTSPIIKLNLHGNYLFLASHDCHVTIVRLGLQSLTKKGFGVTVHKLHELNLEKSLPSPWAASLVAMVPSNIRAEPECPVKSVGEESSEGGRVCHHKAVDSILFNFGGRLFMIQQELTLEDQLGALNCQVDKKSKGVWSFGNPVCLAASVEAMWTPPPLTTPPMATMTGTSGPCISRHLSESLWMSSGSGGMKVWLPLFPRDEGHLSFLSKRIMLTLPCPVYPQVVMFADAVLFGLSHETAFSEQLLATRDTFPFSTIERTTNIFLHHILRQLLRRNLGGHALHIARSYSHLPYFSHVLELMLHEILEEEAPGTMPIPDALLPRVVEYIKQFPEFLETVGHCARKTEVALWQYLFAAVGNPRDLFEWCIVDGRLQTAATYLIIIQNLEVPAVSRQLATRLLDAALESSNWALCKDLVRFLKAIGPGEAVESPSSTPFTPHKPHPPLTPSVYSSTPSASTPSASTAVGGATSNGPDLDRSVVQKTRDRLTSGSMTGSINLSVDYKDSSGKTIKRPQFVLDMDSREDYFMELILSRHARKLLMVHSVRDLGRFSAHLDFPLQAWLVRERERAACIEDFPHSLRQLHVEFQWPFPRAFGGNNSSFSADDDEDDQLDTFSPKSDHTARTGSTLACHAEEETVTDTTALADSEDSVTESKELGEHSSTQSSAKLKRGYRPPNLDLSPSKTGGGHEQHNVTLEPSKGDGDASQLVVGGVAGEAEHILSSTPTKHSGSVSEKVSLTMKQNQSSSELNVDMSSIGEEGSDWDLSSDVTMVTGVGGSSRGSPQAEKEMRYLLEVMLQAGCLDWSVLLTLMLLDVTLLAQAIDSYTDLNAHHLDMGVVGHTLKGVEQLQAWSESECPGYLVLLNHISQLVKQLYDSLSHHHLHSIATSAGSPSQVADCRTPGAGTTHPDTADSPTDHTSTPSIHSNRYSSNSESLEQESSAGCVLS